MGGRRQGIRSIGGATSLATRLPAALVGVSLVSLVVAILVAVATGRDLGDEITEDRIDALQGSATFDVAAHMNGLGRTARALAVSPQAAEAVAAFTEAHGELLDIPLSELEEEARAVVTLHQTDYIEPLRAAGRDAQLRDISAANSASLYLQFHYAVQLGVFDAPASIDDARDGSTWSDVHRVIHPVYREVVDQTGIVDLLLIEPGAGHIVYSTRKRPDIGTSLEVGPYSGSVVAAIAERILADPGQDLVIGDVSFYDPALTTPVGVIASPIRDGSRLAGILVLVYDTAPLTDILTAGAGWDAAGFPPTGQTFLIGADGTTRSEPRSFLEDPDAHLDATREIGLVSGTDSNLIEASGSTVLLQNVNDAAVLAGTMGDTAIEQRSNVIGVDALSSTVPVPLDDVSWFVVSEVDVAAADSDLEDFEELLIIGTATFIVVLTFLAVAWANQTVRPVRVIADRLASRDTSGPIEVPTRSPIEFHRLAESFESMSDALREQHDQVEGARASRLELLRRMLPPSVAARMVEGDLQSLDEVPQASVIVVVVTGLGGLVDVGSQTGGMPLIDTALAELDDLAERHGLARVKVLGDAYFAACGHDRPLIDHAPRSIAFGLDVQNAIRDLGSARGLDTAIGVHTGPVTVGTTGGRRVLYDVWGATVSSAHLLARRAAAGQILVTDETRAMLPQTIDLVAVDDGDEQVWGLASDSIEGAR